VSYEVAKKRSEPSTKNVTLRDATRVGVEMVRKVADEDRQAFVLVNNQAEGNAPAHSSSLVK
jgi:hypothetical protein